MYIFICIKEKTISLISLYVWMNNCFSRQNKIFSNYYYLFIFFSKLNEQFWRNLQNKTSKTVLFSCTIIILPQSSYRKVKVFVILLIMWIYSLCIRFLWKCPSFVIYKSGHPIQTPYSPNMWTTDYHFFQNFHNFL